MRRRTEEDICAAAGGLTGCPRRARAEPIETPRTGQAARRASRAAFHGRQCDLWDCMHRPGVFLRAPRRLEELDTADGIALEGVWPPDKMKIWQPPWHEGTSR